MSDDARAQEHAQTVAPFMNAMEELIEAIVAERMAPPLQRLAGLERRVADLERAAAGPAASDGQRPR